MRSFICIWLLLLFGFVAKAQRLPVMQKSKTIPGNYTTFSIDNLDNIYLLSTSGQLKKLNPNGDSISVFNDIKRFGDATLVDVSNPVKILLYYKGFSTIAVLDGMLNLKNTIDLRKKNIFNVTAVGLSYDGKIWLYDEMENTLKKLDDNGNVLFKTADFRQLFGKVLAPLKIYDQNQYVYLYDSVQGIYVFDYYGAYKNKIDISHWQQLRVAGKYIYGIANGQLCRYDLNTLKYEQWPIPATLQGCRQLFLRGNKLYALKADGLGIYLVTAN